MKTIDNILLIKLLDLYKYVLYTEFNVSNMFHTSWVRGNKTIKSCRILIKHLVGIFYWRTGSLVTGDRIMGGSGILERLSFS